MLDGCRNSEQSELTANLKYEESLENGITTSIVSIEDAYYYDILSDDLGGVYALTDNIADDDSTDASVIGWKSMDQGNTWEKLLYQPEELTGDWECQAGAMTIAEKGIEAYAVFSEHLDEKGAESISRLFRIRENAYDELDADQVFEQIGDLMWNISIVNAHVISIASGEQCVLYDTEKQEVLKSLTYEPYTVSFLSTQDQFLVYGDEIVFCLNTETLEETEASESLQEFISGMFKENDNSVSPPMYTDGNAIICATTEAVYEYKNGETEKVLSVPFTVNSEGPLNGIMPMCKGTENTYFVSVFGDSGAELKRMKLDEKEEKETLTIYTLTRNEDMMHIATLFQQERTDLNVAIEIGMEDESTLTRTDVIKQLNTELLAGEGPDIIIMDGLSVEQYAEKDLLLPVELEQEEDQYFDNIINTYKSEDILYAIPVGYWLYAVQGPADMVSDFDSPEDLSLRVLSEADKSGLDGYKYSYNYNTYSQYVQFMYDIWANNIINDGLVDVKELETYLSFCSELAEMCDQPHLDETYVTTSILPGIIEIHYNKQVQMSAGITLNATDLAALSTEQKNAGVEYTLYPMYQPCNIISVNANTDHEEIAQEFVNYSLENSVQKTHMNYCLPVARDAFYSVMIGEDMMADGLLKEITLGEEEENFLIYCPEQMKIESLEERIKELDKDFSDDVIIREIVMDELESYLSGTISLEEAVSIAGNKIELYLEE